MPEEGPALGRLVKVWDWPTRIVHWLFVLLIPLAWWTAEEHLFDWHMRIGYVLLGLLLFRLLWGFIGSSTARFASFLRGPVGILQYVRGTSSRSKLPGHNPLGGWSVVALLALMLAQAGLGLFAIDVDGLEGGPLSDRVSFEAGRLAAELHELNFFILLGFIALHVAAILFYTFVRRQKLVRAMFTGSTATDDGADLRPGSGWSLAAALIVAAAAAFWISGGLAGA